VNPYLAALMWRQLQDRKGLAAAVAEERAQAEPAGATSPAEPQSVKRGPGRPRKDA
jgi:hypothetical protein